MNIRKFYGHIIAAGIAATFVLPSGSALAQQAGDAALEEIIVTARKREENLQDVGLSVSAFGRQEIENKYSTDVRDLVSISPNLVIDDTAQGPGGVASIYIRGIGVSEVEKNFDPAVGVVMDGIYIGTMTGGLQRTIDLERVEVLRGPQGTLFGRNTIGGVINMERTRPTMELGGTVRLGYEDYDTTVLEGILNFPLGDQVGVKLTGAYRDQAEGYYTSTCTPGVPVSSVTPPCTTSGQDIGQIEYTNYGINLLWAANDNLEFEYTYDREETTQDTPTLVNASQNNVPPLDNSFCDNFTIPAPTTAFCAPSLTTPTSGDRLNTDVVLIGPQNTFPNGPGWGQGTVPTQRLLGSGPPQEPARDATFDTETHIIEARWDFAGDYRMDFIAGTWETEETVLTDWDATSEVRFHTDRPAEYEQTTAELRFSSTSDGPINWTAGAYWWDSEYEIRLVSILGFFFLPPPGPVPFVTRIEAFGLEPLDLPQFSKQTSESRAVFGEVDWEINDRWTLTVGGRWTEDEKTTNQSGQVPCGIEPLFGPFLPPGEVVTPAPYDELCFGPGGFAANPTADPAIGGDTNSPVTAEHDWSEFTPRVGLKWAVSDGAMAYFTYSTGYRAGGFNGRVDSVESASQPYNQETVDNFEIGYKSQWLDNRLRFNAAIFYMEYEDKQEEVQQTSNTSGTGQRTFALNASDATVSGLEMELLWIPAERWQIRANLGFLDTEYDNFAIDTTGDGMFDTDFSHLDFRRAPEFTGSLGVNYQWQLGPGQMWIGGTWHHIGEHEVDFANKPELSNDAQNLVSAAVNYEYKNALFSVFGHNLLDEDGYTIGFDVAGLWSYAYTRAPRTVGAQVVFRFGE